MINATWRKRFSVLRNRLYLYPAPEAMPRKRLFWLALGLVTLAVIAFSTYFIIYLISLQNAFQTNAEDMGIMDQAIWSTIHGQILHQTVCNIVSDTNCGGFNGISRFALHFEPILLPVSLFYFIWDDPRTLLILQTLIVASGAYPAFLLARLRLRNEWAAVAIAVLYLLYPALQQASAIDFHAVAFTASFLLFTLYFMYTRRTIGLFVFAFLSILCKEEIGVVIVMFGLWSMVFQRRWRTGLALVLLGGITSGLAILIITPHFSPTGHPMLATRYPKGLVQTLLFHPKAFLQQYVLEHSHGAYLRILVAPAAYLPLLAPWVLVMALPSIAINLLSSDVQQYTGLFHYNAEIVPVLIFSTIEALVLILWVVQWMMVRWRERMQASASGRVDEVSGTAFAVHTQSTERLGRLVHAELLVVLLAAILFSTFHYDDIFFGKMPFAQGFQWPHSSAHTELAQHFIDMIPTDASVSAQTKFVPHLSHRSQIYMFPYGTPFDTARPASQSSAQAEYILLDVSGDIYPYIASIPFITSVKTVLLTGKYGVLAAQDGYLLLKRGLAPPGISPYSALTAAAIQDPALNYLLLPNLPASLCANIYVAPSSVTRGVQATFASSAGSLSLVDYNVSASGTLSRSSGMTVMTDWRVNTPITMPLQILFLMRSAAGKEYFASTDVPQLFWCQTNTWKVGTIVRLTSRIFTLSDSKVPYGLAHLSIALLPLLQLSGKIMDMQARLPLHVENASGSVMPTQNSNALQLESLNIVP